MSGRGSQTERHVLDLFREHNRPFGVQGVADYLAQYGIKKTQVQKTLDSLVEAGKITAKEFGKTKIFWPDQSQQEVLTKEELEKKKIEIKELKDTAENEQEELNQLQKNYTALTSSLTLSQIESKLQELTKEKEENETKLKSFADNTVFVSQEERASLETSLDSHLRTWRKWKSAFREIWGTLSENLDKKDSELFEEIGVETDEVIGTSLASFNKFISTKKRKL